MANNEIARTIEESVSQATGFAPRDDMLGTFTYLANAGGLLPAWWSKERDRQLQSFWKSSNYLSLAMYNAQSKLAGIPFRVVARNPTIPEHVDRAEKFEYSLQASSDFGKSWLTAFGKFVEDLLGQDNGAFMEIIGEGPADGPIVGMPLSVRHLDSYRCTRTSDPIYPVVYQSRDGKYYKMHWTRVITMVQMPSPREEMNGVGLCAVSRVADIAQTLLDIVYYKQERLGSRPQNIILIGKKVSGKQIMEAFKQGNEGANNRGNKRYATFTAIGSELDDIGIEKLDLNHMDPFDEETSITLGMFAIAAGFGMDANELWPVSGGATNKADSALRRLRSRGKLPAQTMADLELQFNLKVVPPYLCVKFDFKDDEEDQQRAIIRDIRGRNRERDIGTGTITERTARQQMLDDGDLDRSSFEVMELQDGRLLDGTNIGVLFYSDDPIFSRHLGVDTFSMDILVVNENDPNDAIIEIQQHRTGVLKELAQTSSEKFKKRLIMADNALMWLENEYYRVATRSMPETPVSARRMSTDIVRLERREGTLDEPTTEQAEEDQDMVDTTEEDSQNGEATV